MVKEQKRESSQDSEDLEDKRQLILFNDDVNSFDFVIETLVDVCEHELEQAEQCAMIAHYKGKCSVKTGHKYDLMPFCGTMISRGLTVEIV